MAKILRSGLLVMLIFAVSCSKEVIVKSVKPPVEAGSEFAGSVNGADYKVTTNSIKTTYYATVGESNKALLTNVALNNTGDSLSIFINDFRERVVSLTKKIGTSLNPGSPKVQVNSTVAVPVQPYVRFSKNGSKYYASAGDIHISLNENVGTLNWDVKFKDAEGKEFSSTGTLKIVDFIDSPRPLKDIIDPAPVLGNPVIESLSKDRGLPGDTVFLAGVNFTTTLSDNLVTVNGVVFKVVYATNTKLGVIVPQGFKSGFIKLQVNNGITVQGPWLISALPSLSSVYPNQGRAGDTVKIYGSYFSKVLTENSVLFGGIKARVINPSDVSTLTVIVPELSRLLLEIKVTVNGFDADKILGFTRDDPYPDVNWVEVFSATSLQKTNLMASTGKSIVFTGGANSSYLYYSADGKQYSNIYSSLPFNKAKKLEIHSLIADRDKYYIATNLGVAKSTDGGINWKKLTPNITEPDKSFSSIVSVAGNIYLLADEVMYHSVNDGDTWDVTQSANSKNLSYLMSYIGSNKYLFAVDTQPQTATHNSATLHIANPALGNMDFYPVGDNTTGVYHFNEGYPDFLKASSFYLLAAYSPVNSPSIENQKLYRSLDQGRSWEKTGNEVCYVVKANRVFVAYGSRSFNLSTNGATTFKSYPLPQGYILGGIEITDSYYYITCINASGTSKVFRSARQ
ncbi:MAG: IPT/TIG domain-containing protein [Mucilaginibacter sp.]|nr:IPT/TIG domain-containing protein [Mucilaginibacter sp.]